MQPIVSVIMPTYNRAHLLPKAIDSVFSQTYPEIELIVVNDGSTDNTEEALEPYRDKITYIKKENGGCGDAKNAGLKVANGKYITHLDDDDLMMPERIERLVDFFTENPDIGLCATSAYLIDVNDLVIGIKSLRNVPQKTRLLHLLMGHVAVQSNMMVPIEVFQQVGEYSTVHCEDYDMWLRIARRYEIGAIEDPLVKYRKHSNQITAFINHVPVMASLKQINLSFLQTVPMEEIIPSLQFPAVGHALIGTLLSRHKLFDFAYDEICRAPKDGTAQLWLAMLFLYRRDFDKARTSFGQVPQSHPCHEEIPRAFSLIDKTEQICAQYTAKDNNSEEVIQLRRELQLFNLCLFDETLKMATGGKVCLKD
jgi:hypothetical protein